MWILGKTEPSWKPGGRPARRGKRQAVGSGQWRGIDVVRWLKIQEMGSPHLQETVMHRVSVIVHCVAVIHYNNNRNRILLYYLFQENKSFGTIYHLHSSSDGREVVSSTGSVRPDIYTNNNVRLDIDTIGGIVYMNTYKCMDLSMNTFLKL